MIVFGDTEDFRVLQVAPSEEQPKLPMVYVNKSGLKHVIERGVKLKNAYKNNLKSDKGKIVQLGGVGMGGPRKSR